MLTNKVKYLKASTRAVNKTFFRPINQSIKDQKGQSITIQRYTVLCSKELARINFFFCPGTGSWCCLHASWAGTTFLLLHFYLSCASSAQIFLRVNFFLVKPSLLWSFSSLVLPENWFSCFTRYMAFVLIEPFSTFFNKGLSAPETDTLRPRIINIMPWYKVTIEASMHSIANIYILPLKLSDMMKSSETYKFFL